MGLPVDRSHYTHTGCLPRGLLGKARAQLPFTQQPPTAEGGSPHSSEGSPTFGIPVAPHMISNPGPQWRVLSTTSWPQRDRTWVLPALQPHLLPRNCIRLCWGHQGATTLHSQPCFPESGRGLSCPCQAVTARGRDVDGALYTRMPVFLH